MIKVIPIFALLVATQYTSCDNPGIDAALKTNSAKTEAACIDHGGVPIYQVDTYDGVPFSTVLSCSFPPVINIKGEK